MLKRKLPELMTGTMPTQSQINTVEAIIREHSGEYNIRDLWNQLPASAGITATVFSQILETLTAEHKIAYDRNGIIGWIWNPGLVKKYLDDPSLTINI